MVLFLERFLPKSICLLVNQYSRQKTKDDFDFKLLSFRHIRFYSEYSFNKIYKRNYGISLFINIKNNINPFIFEISFNIFNLFNKSDKYVDYFSDIYLNLNNLYILNDENDYNKKINKKYECKNNYVLCISKLYKYFSIKQIHKLNNWEYRRWIIFKEFIENICYNYLNTNIKQLI